MVTEGTNVIKVHYIHMMKCHKVIHYFVQIVKADKNRKAKINVEKSYVRLWVH
jgi:hypothetical protein